MLRVLGFENNGVGKETVVSFRFTRHPRGVKCSRFIGSFVIPNTLDGNVTGASDLTQNTIRKHIYLDDLIFNV